MNKSIRLICFILCAVLISFSLTGCYDNTEIEDLAYVIAIGIDEAGGNSFDLTFQTAVPKAITEGGGEGTSMITFKTDNFLVGLKKTGEYLSRKINLSHTKIIVVSEGIARKGVTAFLNGLQHGLEVRQNINIIVASEGAKKYIESIQPKLSANPSKYYELLFKAYETDFLVPATQLEDYLYRAKNQGAQPVAIYTAMDRSIEEGKKSSGDEGGGNSAGGSGGGGSGDKKPEEGKGENMSIMGLAVFKTDKMVGTLNAEQASIFSLLTGSRNISLDIADPLDHRFKVLSNVKREKNSRTRVTVRNGKPFIDIDLVLDIEVQAVQSDFSYDEKENADKLAGAYKTYINQEIEKLLSKVTYEYKTDIFGYGELAKRNFMTIREWEKFNWPESFPKTEYGIDVQAEVITHG